MMRSPMAAAMLVSALSGAGLLVRADEGVRVMDDEPTPELPPRKKALQAKPREPRISPEVETRQQRRAREREALKAADRWTRNSHHGR